MGGDVGAKVEIEKLMKDLEKLDDIKNINHI